jgi:flavodoxin
MGTNTLLILTSYHHQNTLKIARIIAEVLAADIKTPQQTNPETLQEYTLLGFGSGIYSEQHHPDLLTLIDRLPFVTGKKAFIFSTCGAPAFAVDGGHVNDYIIKFHTPLREKLQVKGYHIIGEFNCAGWNTNSFLKFFGGINKGRPNETDCAHAKTFALDLKKKHDRSSVATLSTILNSFYTKYSLYPFFRQFSSIFELC